MASRKKESEGIALLSIYGDEDDDDMEEDTEESPHEQAEETEEPEKPQNEAEIDTLITEDDSEAIISSKSINYSSSDRMISFDSANDDTPPISTENLNSKPFDIGNNGSPKPIQTQLSVSSSPLLPPLLPPQVAMELNISRKGTLTIVDYGHDEGALSPEVEDGEIAGVGRVTFGAELQTTIGTPSGRVQGLTPNTHATPQISEQLDPSLSDPMNYESNEVEPTGHEEAVDIIENKDMDPLEKFLPPPPKAKCSDELQEKIAKFIFLKKKTGRSYNSEVRNRKDYRNPDFLLHAVTYQDIDQIGSCFSKDVFDPHGYDKSDYYDEIEADLKREMERKEQEKKKSQKVDFLSGGTQSGTVVPSPKITLPIPAVPTVAGGGQHPVSSAVDGGRDGRQNKKSKWDKVDVQDPISSAGAQSALVSAANAGAGYTAFAQQRRREVEERKSSDRKLDRRS